MAPPPPWRSPRPPAAPPRSAPVRAAASCPPGVPSGWPAVINAWLPGTAPPAQQPRKSNDHHLGGRGGLRRSRTGTRKEARLVELLLREVVPLRIPSQVLHAFLQMSDRLDLDRIGFGESR